MMHWLAKLMCLYRQWRRGVLPAMPKECWPKAFRDAYLTSHQKHPGKKPD